ncbi:hypothetical protein JCM18237_07100 [Halorubrum luteum]
MPARRPPERPHDPRVRVARPTDAGRVRELQSLLREPSPELLEYGLAVGSALVSVADSSEPLEAEHAVGYLLAVDSADRPSTHLAELAVDTDYRREGRARGLLWTTIDDADGPVTLQVHPDNDAARALYMAVGFEVVDRRPGFYDDGDALVLRREPRLE